MKRRSLKDTSKPPSSADDWVQAESEAETVQPQVETQQPKSEPKRGRPTSKSKDPDYTKMGLYVKKDIHRKLKADASLQGKELSELAEEIFSDWLENRQE